MKKLLFFISLLTSFDALSDCAIADIQGEWEIKYFMGPPQQVGVCNLVFDNNLTPSGNCYNITYDESSNIFDGSVSISTKCVMKGKGYLEDGQKFTLSAKMSPDKQILNGTVSAKMNSYTWKGTMKGTKKGGLSCSVIKN